MNQFIKYFLFGLAFVAVGLLAGFKITDRSVSTQTISVDEGMDKLYQAISFIQRKYVKSVDNEKLVDDAIMGMLEGLDPHSLYISKKEMQRTKEDMQGSFSGIGIEFSILEDTIYVVAPLSGGPSEKLGINAGDRIVKVDGETVAGKPITNSDVMRYLKGEKGSAVKVSILRRGVEELLDFNIIRDDIPIHSVAYSYMLNDHTGFIQVTRFSETTYDEFSDKLYELKNQGMKNLILDLRGNPGGYLGMAYQMADEFLSGGKVIVSTDGRIAESKQKYRSTSALSSFEEGGLVILIDYGSASASEIVSGAVQDHDRGLIVGVRSFGKGLVQLQEEFEDGSAMRVVISEYFTPSGRCIQKPYDKSTEEYDQEILDRFESGEIYDESKIDIPDSLIYKTTSGRIVYGGGGIYPDVFVADDTTMGSKYLTALTINDLFRGFAYNYSDDHPELVERYPTANAFVKGFPVTEQLLEDFKAYATSHDVPFVEKDYERSEKVIRNRLKAYVGRKLFKDDGFFPVFHELDGVLQRAVELMPVAKKLQQTGKLVMD